MKKLQSISILAISLALVVVVSPIEASAADLKKLADELVNNIKVDVIHQEGDPIPDIDITIDQPQLPDTQRGIEKSDIRRGMRSVQNETTDITIDQPRGREMVMLGDNVTVTAKLIVPVALNKGLRFAIREGEAMFEEDDEDMLEKSRIEKQEGTITTMKRLPDYPLNVIEHRMKSGTVKFFNETKGFKDELSNGVNLVYIGTGVLRTTDVTGEIFLSEGREMVMPGDNVLVGEKRKDYSSIDNSPEEKERGIAIPPREVDKPFLMPSEDVFPINGRGTVSTGRIETGVINSSERTPYNGIDQDCDGDGYSDLACHTVGAGVVAEIVKGIDGTPKTPAISISITISTPKEPIRVVKEIKL